MALIVLHCNGNGHESSLDDDVRWMGQHYGAVTHVLQNTNLDYRFPNPQQEVNIHILAHGGADHVADLTVDTFKTWMVSAFQMTSYPTLTQRYFIYSCDIALGGASLLSGLAHHIASLKIRNRTLIGTAGENGTINTNQGLGKMLVKRPGTDQLQALGAGWKGYRTVMKNNPNFVVAEKLSGPEVTQLVLGVMNW